MRIPCHSHTCVEWSISFHWFCTIIVIRKKISQSIMLCLNVSHNLWMCIMTYAFMLEQSISVPSFCPPPPALRWYRYLNTDIVLLMLVPFGSKASHWRQRIYSWVYFISNDEINFYHPVIAIQSHNKWWCSSQNHIRGNYGYIWMRHGIMM